MGRKATLPNLSDGGRRSLPLLQPPAFPNKSTRGDCKQAAEVGERGKGRVGGHILARQPSTDQQIVH